MNTLIKSSNEKEIERLIDYIPNILKEVTDITSFYKSQARINNLYRRTKGIIRTSFVNNYTPEYIEIEFHKTREELDNIYNKIIGV